MLDLLVLLLVFVLVIVIVFWLMDLLGLPEPTNRIVRVIIVLIAIVYLLTRVFPGLGGAGVAPLALIL